MGVCNVFNIERFATEDGRGIRTVVFLKGCSLRCRWCANPESQRAGAEVLVKTNVCINCARCSVLCPEKAISYMEGYGFITDQSKCRQCGVHQGVLCGRQGDDGEKIQRGRAFD